ncbi:VirD4-like conjugal transfer protein, CD1115 family [Butyrivibrio sp. FCS014]|uniref:VirD4-like conjugal transfer protein, CD1115 family n=1 Tax=Butyrivibrio sp. FCS014 TaxID=1408304 RepID=UPI000465232B|nr:type IV secretory system conjugative DNA transfer family protein [Butyrivibrio sp. FCS014]
MRDTFTQCSNTKFSMPKKGDMILANGQFYSMDCYKTLRNNNVLIVGASGAGKTRSIITPNILQAQGSYIISDPKGKLWKDYGEYLKRKGYKVKKIDFIHPEKSDSYNFFDYIRTDYDTVKIARMLSYLDYRGGRFDPFWDEATVLYLSAIISYLHEFRPRDEQNLSCIGKLAVASNVEEYSDGIKNPVDRIMDNARRSNSKSFAVKQYDKFRVAAAKTLKSILISCNAKLATMDTPGVEKMMGGDNSGHDNQYKDTEPLDFREVGSKKTAIFVVISDSDRAMDPLANLFFTQAMNELCTYADDECPDCKLPVPVRFIMDDFATNVSIDEFPRMISAIRSRGISTMLSIQSEAQLSHRYGEDGRTIIGNCDNYVYLGGNDVDTARSVARRADIPEKKVLNMPVGMNIIFRRGEEPVFAKNFELEKLEERLGLRKEEKTEELMLA